jgi:uncharacterized membrane protein
MANETARAKSPAGRQWLRRPRLTSGLLAGLVAYAFLILFAALDWRMSFIAAWDIGATIALLALYFGLRKSSAATMKRNALREDAGKWAVLAFTLIAATASLVVITAEMPLIKSAGGVEKIARAALVIYTVVLSWALIHTVFALHYAHDYYYDLDVSPAHGSGVEPLRFPGKQAPTYGDFLYFSFTIGMTFQVSDVQIADSDLRRLALVHGAVAFFYTTGILALAINLVAGLI